MIQTLPPHHISHTHTTHTHDETWCDGSLHANLAGTKGRKAPDQAKMPKHVLLLIAKEGVAPLNKGMVMACLHALFTYSDGKLPSK